MTASPLPSHRPQSMSDAVEVAARAIFEYFDRIRELSVNHELRVWDEASNKWPYAAHAALSAIGLPELLAEVERLRGVASAAKRVAKSKTLYENGDLWQVTGVDPSALADLAALLASEALS